MSSPSDLTTDRDDDLTAALHALVADVALDDHEPIDLDTDLLLGGLVDSMGVVQVVQWLEDRFETEIDPADVVLENFRSIRAILDFVDRSLVPEAG